MFFLREDKRKASHEESFAKFTPRSKQLTALLLQALMSSFHSLNLFAETSIGGWNNSFFECQKRGNLEGQIQILAIIFPTEL